MESPDEDLALSESSASGAENFCKSEPSDHQKLPQHISSSTRLMRNLAEKMRRDKLNMHISELASIVPMVATATKRVDKTSVLRLSAAYLRIHQSLLNEKFEKFNWKPYFLQDDVLSSMLLEAVNGFVLVITSTGKVIYVSDGIEKTLGHSPVDIVGNSIYTIIHPDDYSVVRQQMHFDQKSQRRSFYCHFAERCLSRNDCGRYNLVHVLGHLRAMEPQNEDNQADVLVQIQENLLICLVKLIRNQPITELSWMDGCHDEYITHHSLDARIICSDHRISIIAGYLPEEVVGKSAYDYIYAEDIPWSLLIHKQMFENDDNSDIKALYRLTTKTKKLIYLKSRGVLQCNSITGEMDSFLCINKLLSDKEGKIEHQRFMSYFSPTVKNIQISDIAPNIDLPASVKNLKQLPSPSTSGSRNGEDFPKLEEEHWCHPHTSFSLSTLPSLSKVKMLHQSLDDLQSSTQKQKRFDDDKRERYEKALVSSDNRKKCKWLDDAIVSPDSLFQESPLKSPEQRLPPKNVCDQHFERVTSTTCDEDLVPFENVSAGDTWDSHKVKVKCAVSTKRASKRQAQQNGAVTGTERENSTEDAYRCQEFHLTSPAVDNCSNKSVLSQIPRKKRRSNRLEMRTAESVRGANQIRSRPR